MTRERGEREKRKSKPELIGQKRGGRKGGEGKKRMRE